MGSVLLETSRQQKLLRVMDERGFTLSQQNGQRIYGGPPPNWGGRIPPSRESEIFIGRIPRLCFEDELIPLFSSIGELYEFRLMLDFSGTNRGFAYAQYADEDSAFKAMKILNHYEIRPGHCIGVLRCKNNCRLLFSNIKQDMGLDIFSESIKSLTKDILKISMYENFEELKTLEIGVNLEIDEAFQERVTRYAPESKFAIVEYETHKAAAVARRILIPKLGHMYGIDWAIPPKDSKHFDHGLSARFDASLAAGNDFLKIRPVPTFSPPRSNLDAVLYMPGIFKNISKYFKYLVITTLHKSMRKGDIPLPVYWELEKKIIERVKNIEHCSQATQLLLNYLTWYREKMMMFIDPESEKILIEVKYYAEKMMEIAQNRVAHPRRYRSCLGEQFDEALPVNLNFCYYMAVFLGGDDRDKVCGLITDSLDWLSRMMQRAKNGNLEVNQFMTEITRLAIEMEEEKRSEQFVPPERIRKRKPELMPLPTHNTVEWNPFYGQSVPPLKKSAVASGEQNQDRMETDSAAEPTELQTGVCINKIGSIILDNSHSTQTPAPNSQPRQVTSTTRKNKPDNMDTDSSVSPTEPPICQGQNKPANTSALGTCGAAYEYWPDTANQFSVAVPQVSNRFNLIPRKIVSNASGGEGSIPVGRTETIVDMDTGTRISRLTVPSLVPQPYATDFSIMPRQFLNMLPYFKYITIVNLQKTVERCELTLQTYREIMTNIIDKMTNLEECIKGIRIIVAHLKYSREGLVTVSHRNLIQILDDVKIYGGAVINYVRNRGLGVPANPELDDYYLRLFPNLMSFLYHLTLLLDDEEKEKFCGRLVDSVKWVQELVEKNKGGDVDVVAFFEKIIRVGERPDANPGIREIIKDAYDEFNTISEMPRGAGN